MRPKCGPTDWSLTHYNLHGNQQVSLATVSSHSLLRHYRSESTGWVTVRESRQVSVFDLVQGHCSIQELTPSPYALLFRFQPLIFLYIMCSHTLFCPFFSPPMHPCTIPAFPPSPFLCCFLFPLSISDLLSSMDYYVPPNYNIVS